MAAILGGIVTLIGSIFLFLAALGLIRMPDLYNRMQAGTKATTLGTMLFLLGIGIAVPGWLGKMIVLILFVVFTNPVSSHALARASHFVGVSLGDKAVVDELAAESAKESKEEEE